MGPHPGCIIWHWASCRLLDQNNADSLQRMQQARSDHDLVRQFGFDVLRNSIQAALRGEKTLNFSYYLIGAAFWPDLDGLFARVFQGLHAQNREQRIAATFASAYYMDREEVACLIAERVVVEEGDRLTIQAAREVLEIGSAVRFGGECPRCGRRRTDTTPRLSDLDTVINLPRKEPST